MPAGTQNSVQSELHFSPTHSECDLQQGIKTKIAQAGLAPYCLLVLTLVPGTTLGVTLALWLEGKKLFTADGFAIWHSCVLYVLWGLYGCV